jgi:hypothetical protein
MEVGVGAQIHPQQASCSQMRDAWFRVEEMGADTLFNWDHFSRYTATETANTSSAGLFWGRSRRAPRGWSSGR